MLPVGGKAFVEYLIWNLKRHGICQVLFSIGYLAEQFSSHFGTGAKFGVQVEYSIEQEPLGTGGALKLARQKLDSVFLVINGDTLFDINYLDLMLVAKRNESLATMALRVVDDTARYGRVGLEGERITTFYEKGASGLGVISAGIYLLQRESMSRLPSGPSSLENDLFPVLAQEGKLFGKTYRGLFIDIGLPETLAQANALAPAWFRKPVLFLDRDGVINIDYGYVHQPANFSWIEGAPETIKWFNDNGYLVIVLTNQAGIGRGYYTEEQFLQFTAWINQQLAGKGAHIDATYYCPHHPEAGKGKYLRSCECRKPLPGLIDQAVSEWEIDLQKSVLIGDKEKDILAGRARGLRGYLFPGGNLNRFVSRIIELDN